MRFHEFFGGFYPGGFNKDWQRNQDEDDKIYFESEPPAFSEDDDWFDNDSNEQGILYRFGVDGFHDDLFSIMDQFMKGFGQHQFPTFPHDQSIPPTPEPSLRDQVLKKPDAPVSQKVVPRQPPDKFNSMLQDFFGQSFFAPFLEEVVPKEDKDLDKEINEKGLDAVLDQPSTSQESRMPSQRKGNFLFQGMQESRSTIRRADGTSEQRITKRDSQGNEETTIIYESADGQRHTVVERNNGDGTSQSSDWRSGVLKDERSFSQTPGSDLFSQMMKVFEDIFPR